MKSYAFGKTKKSITIILNDEVHLYYDVPYKRKEEAKLLKMKWNKIRKQWYKEIKYKCKKTIIEELEKNKKFELIDIIGLTKTDEIYDEIMEYLKNI